MKPIAAHLPESYARYIEPFAGGAAMFFALRPDRGILADINSELIDTYRTVARDPNAVIEGLSRLKNNSQEYYRVRNLTPGPEIERAVRMLFLMRLSFNGIYRVNLRGTFNVPYGHKTWMSVCDATHLRACSVALSKATLLVSSYRETLDMATRGDLVYIDPPYTVAHNNNGFLKYNEKIFSWQDQKDLAKSANEAADRGAYVIVSNADHKDIHALYDNFDRSIIQRYASVSGIGAGRRHVSEGLYVRKNG